MASKSEDYVPLMCTHQSAISRELVEGDPRVLGISALLLIRCHVLLNGGRFENARAGFLLSELERGFAGLTLDMAEIILAGDRPPFWHWEGNALAVDFYSVPHEQTLLARSRGGRNGALRRWKRRKCKPTENESVNSMPDTMPDTMPDAIKEISPKGDISNSPSPLGAGGAFDDEGHPCPPQATPEEVQAFIREMRAYEQQIG